MKNNRKVYLINPQFQLRYMGYMIGATFIVLVIFYMAQLYFFKDLLSQGIELKLPANHAYFKLIRAQQETLNKIFAVTSFFLFIFQAVFGLLMSHKVAGPQYRLKKFLDEHAEGQEVPELSFREGDFFQEIPEAFNNFMKKEKVLKGESKVS